MATSFVSLLPRPQEPVALYGPAQLQSLANMRTQQQAQQQTMQQQATMAPLILQGEQLKVAQAQKQADDLAIENKIVADAAQASSQRKAAAPTTPAAPPPPPPPPPPPVTSSLATGGAAPAAPPPIVAVAPQTTPLAPTTSDAVPPAARVYGPAVPTSLAALQPAQADATSAASLAGLGNSAAPGFTPPAAPITAAAPSAPSAPLPATPGSLQDQEDADIAQKMNAAGLGYRVPALMEARAIARSNQIKAQEAQQDQDDQRIGQDAYNKSHGDLDLMRQYMQANGASFKSLANLKAYQDNQTLTLLKTKEAQDDLGAKDFAQDQRNHEQLRDHLDAFAKLSASEQQARWQNWLTSNRDLMTADHMADTMQAHPDGPPNTDQLKLYSSMLTTKAMAEADAAHQALITNAARGQRDDLISSLGGQQTKAGYDRTLQSSPIPHTDIPTSDQMFDAGGKPIPGQFKMLNRMALTPEQRQAADNAHDQLMASENYKGAMIGLSQQRINQGQERIDNTNNGQGNALQPLMNKVWTDTVAAKQSGGTDPSKVTPADAVAYLKDPQRWGDDENISAKRTALIAAFGKANTSELNQGRIAAQTESAQATAAEKNAKTNAVSEIERGAWIRAHPGKTYADATDAAVMADRPKKPGTAATPAASNAVQSPVKEAPLPPAKIRVRLSDGRTGSIDATDFDPKTMTKLAQ